MAATKQQKSKTALGMTAGQQWLALSLIALLGVLAVFFFNFGTGSGGGGHSGFISLLPL